MMIDKGEIARKVIHLSNLVIPFSYLFIFPVKKTMIGILIIFTIISLIVEYFRNKNGIINNLFNRYLNFMLRNSEHKGKYTGATWVFMGALATIIIFPKDIAVLALVFMSVGDTAAAIAGKAFGKIKIGDKTLEGTITGIIAAWFASLLFPQIPMNVRILGVATAMITELLPLPLNDNFTIPIVSGLVMLILTT